MGRTLNITVADKVATYRSRDGYIVCGNSDYVIQFAFDSDWDAHTEKTARFVLNGQFVDVDFTGTECSVPIITNVSQVEVGVYAGDLCTTTPAIIECKKSILCEEAEPSVENDKSYANEAKEAADRAESAAQRAEESAEKGEVVQTTGTSETAVMSQKASTDSFVPMRQQLNNGNWAYVTKADGTQGLIQVQYGSALSDTIVGRKYPGGRITIGDPTEDNNATTKKYVDDNFVPKLTSTAGTKIYGESNEEGTRLVELGASASKYSIVYRDGNMQAKFGTPTEFEHVATKGYVDDKVAEVSGGGGSGSVTLYRHYGGYDCYWPTGVDDSDASYFTFFYSYISSTKNTFESSLEGLCEWIAANGALQCTGCIALRDGTTQEELYALDAWDGNIALYSRSSYGNKVIHKNDYNACQMSAYYRNCMQI